MKEMTFRFTEALKRLAFEHHDYCCSCLYKFEKGDTAHHGFDDIQTPLYVCDKCSYKLSEVVIRTYFTHRPYEVPESQNRLWRYMDFTKYMSLLSTGKMYFSRSDHFYDVFEGAKGYLSNKEKWDKHYYNFFRENIINPPNSNACPYSTEEVDRQAKELLAHLTENGAMDKKSTFISCWHENERESEAMWRLYSSFLPNAIAIKTSYERLYTSLGKNPEIMIGRVKYIDYRDSFSDINSSFWRKRKSFEHEKEVRAMMIDHKDSGVGKSVECNLETLIEEVLISPTSPQWFYELVSDINKKFELNVPVKKSELLELPFY